MAAHKMLFTDSTFHIGINLSVRRGSKWLKAHVGDDIALFSLGEKEPAQSAVVIGLAKLRFFQVPDEWLTHEHTEACRKRDGLRAVLRSVYSDFKDTDEVTLVWFYVGSREPLRV